MADEFKDKNPVFNQGIDYLKRISELVRSARNSSITQDYHTMYDVLWNLQIELEGYLDGSEDFESINTTKKSCESLLNCNYSVLNRDKILKNKLMEWFRQLNIVIHKNQLGMPDKGGFGGLDV